MDLILINKLNIILDYIQEQKYKFKDNQEILRILYEIQQAIITLPVDTSKLSKIKKKDFRDSQP